MSQSILIPLGIILAMAASVIVRFRRARGEERQQLKWLAYRAGFSISMAVLGWLNIEVLHNRVAVEQSEEWVTGRRYPDMEELREHRRSEAREREEATLM